MATNGIQIMIPRKAHDSPRIELPIMDGLVFIGAYDSGDEGMSRINRAPNGGRMSLVFDGAPPTIAGQWTEFKAGTKGYDTGIPEPAFLHTFLIFMTAASLVTTDTPMFLSAFNGAGLFHSLAADSVSNSIGAIAAQTNGSPAYPLATVSVPKGVYGSPSLVSAVVTNDAVQVNDHTRNINGAVINFTGGRAPSGRNLLVGTAYPGSSITGVWRGLIQIAYSRILTSDEVAVTLAALRAYAKSQPSPVLV